MTPTTVALAPAPGGVRTPVIGVYDPRLQTTSLCLAVAHGARRDPEGASGVAHLLEHLLFSLPAGGRHSFAEQIERMGGQTNAETGLETMLFYAQVAAEDAEVAAPAMLRSVLTPVFDHAIFDREREVVVKELVTAAADPADLVQDAVFAKLFPGHLLSRPIGGDIEELKRLTVAEVEGEHRRDFLHRPRALVVVGPRPIEGLDELLAELTAAPAELPAEAPAFAPLPAADTSLPRWPLDRDFAWVCLAARSCELNSSEEAAYKLIATLLGSSPSSLLYRKLRGEEALSYSFESWNRSYSDTGVWRLLAGVEPQNADRLVEIVDGLLADLAEGRLTEEDFDSARRKAEMRLVLQAESPLDHAQLIAMHTRAGTLDWSLTQARADLRAVTRPQLAAAAATLRANLVVAVRPDAS
ncbi:peptidase M16 [Kitasatospora sp. MMS16-BH015]|uniref:M16 family metallopeptidase n=1 Tax=Kitasatospora sp. MMS16-BH015 TaxID=2018025 RepID=UPI000CA301D3|nr:pitrilysin family protein [Kitasatospora sp. MMS16-BH015]AUG78260.1 peptidase M16 [Kitasatospora sp. MMS16-BH015]